MGYPAKIEKDGNGFMVSFRDLPGVFSQGDTVEEARLNAVDALETYLFFTPDAAVPNASKARRKEYVIDVSPTYAAKLLLLDELQNQSVRPSELARRMGVRPQDVTRLLDPRRYTKLELIASAFTALGKRLELSIAA